MAFHSHFSDILFYLIYYYGIPLLEVKGLSNSLRSVSSQSRKFFLNTYLKESKNTLWATWNSLELSPTVKSRQDIGALYLKIIHNTGRGCQAFLSVLSHWMQLKRAWSSTTKHQPFWYSLLFLSPLFSKKMPSNRPSRVWGVIRNHVLFSMHGPGRRVDQA